MQIALDFGVLLYEFGPAALVRLARRAEACGFDFIACGDHLVLPEDLPLRDTAHMDKPVARVDASSATARRIFRQGAPMPDVFQWFTWMAAATTRLAFATAIYILPLRHPLVAARSAATFDFLSSGRLYMGVGAGWIPQEHEIAGMDFRTRGRRMNECIEIMRRLWRDEEPEFSGEFYSFPKARFEPKPVQRPGPPIMVGGESDAAMRRAALLGDGWCARVHSPQSLRENIAKLQGMRHEAGRGAQRFIIQCRNPPGITAAEVRALAEAGADQISVAFRQANDEGGFLAEIERLSALVEAK